jgi:hypothetical protein
VLFDVYNPIAVDGITAERVPMTLKTIVTLVQDYPESKALLTGSKADGKPTPDVVKKILFLMLASDIMNLEFHIELNCAVFSLSRCTDDITSFALTSDSYWNNIEIK